MNLKLILLLILKTLIINNSISFDLNNTIIRLSSTSTASIVENLDYDNEKYESRTQIECKSDLNCIDSNSICIDGYCVKLCSYSKKLKLNRNCVYFHCDSKQLISSDQDNSSPIPIETNNSPRYLNKKKCSWILKNTNHLNETAQNSFIQLKIERFSTQFDNDYLYIFAGDSVYSPLIAAISGAEIASNNPFEQAAYLENKGSIHQYDNAIDLTFFNTTSLFLLFKSDIFTSHSTYKSQFIFDDIKPKGISIKYKFSSPCNDSNSAELNPSTICLNDFKEKNIESYKTDFIETIKYKNSDDLNVLNSNLNRAYHCSFLFEDFFYVIGGFSFSKKLSFISRLNLSSLVWEHNIDRRSSTIVNRSNRNFFSNISNFDKPPIDLPSNRYSHSCVLDYENKRFYMFGGVLYDFENNQNGAKKTTNELWIYNLETNKWSLLNEPDLRNSFKEDKNYELPIAVSGHSIHLIKKSITEQILYIFFGYSEYYGSTLNIIQEYNLLTKKWTYNQTSYLNIGYGHTSVYDNRTNVIYFHGGIVINSDRYTDNRNYQTPLMSSFIYSFSLIGLTWTELAKSVESSFMQSAVLYNNKIIFYGGICQTDDFQKILFNSNKMKFYETIKNEFEHDFTIDGTKKSFKIKNRQRFAHTSFIYENFMYIFGGFNGFCLNDMFKIDLRNISDIQKIEIGFRKKRQGLKTMNEFEDFFGNRINQISSHAADIDFVAKYEIPSGYANRQMGLNEYCKTHKTCNLCHMDSNCVWNGNYCDHYSPTNSSIKQLFKKPSCSQMCNDFKSCSNCTSLLNINGQYQNNCVWCASQSKCVQKKALAILYPFGECFNLISDRDQCERQMSNIQTGAKITVNTCSLIHSNCSSCITDERCGWCTQDSLNPSSLNTGFGTCIEGGEGGSLKNQCKQNWFFSECPSCECNGHSICNNSSNCGKCMNNTQGDYCSECKQGYFGKAKNNGVCNSCECGEQATDCDNTNGKCFCNTKGVVGLKCDLCDSPRYTGRPNMTDGTCYYNLTTDYQFTFNLNKDSDRFYTKINFVNHPMRGSDDDIDFMVRCFKSSAFINLSYVVDDFGESNYDSYVVPDYNQSPISIDFLDNLTLAFNNLTYTESFSSSAPISLYPTYDSSGYYFGPISRYNILLEAINCSSGEYKYTFTNRDLNYADKNRNLIFIVNVYDFQTPITIQIAFSRKSKIQLLHFFITFFGCLLSLLTIAFITWKSKQRFDRYRRQRQIVIQMEQMASRPFTRLLVDITEDSKRDFLEPKPEKEELIREKKRKSIKKSDKKSRFFKNSGIENELEIEKTDSKLKVMPVGVEPLSNNKSAIVTCLLRLPQGGQIGIPKGSSLFMLGSTYVNLNSSSGLMTNGSTSNEQQLIDEETEMENQAGKTVES